MLPTLAVAGGVSVLTAVAFAVVGRAVLARDASDHARLARAAHATWWLALAVYLALQGGLTIAAAFGRLTSEAYFASRVVAIPLLCAGAGGITAYLLFLYAGRRGLMWSALLGYAGVAALFYYVTFSQPTGLRIGDWLVGVDDSAPLYRLVYALVGLPPIAASIAYLALLRKVETREQRYRVVLVAGSILLYVGSGLAARLRASDEVIFVTLVLFGLGAAIASLAAYYPPPSVRARLRGDAR
jgi:hypothetical protein